MSAIQAHIMFLRANMMSVIVSGFVTYHSSSVVIIAALYVQDNYALADDPT